MTKFKVGDRVVMIGSDVMPGTVHSRNDEGRMSIHWDENDGPDEEWWRDSELIPFADPYATVSDEYEEVQEAVAEAMQEPEEEQSFYASMELIYRYEDDAHSYVVEETLKQDAAESLDDVLNGLVKFLKASGFDYVDQLVATGSNGADIAVSTY